MKNQFFTLSVVVFLLLVNLFFVSTVLGDTGDKINENIDKLEDTQENIQTKWDYLGSEWQTILLKNKFVSAADDFLKKISFVFEFLFGEPYSLSLTLLIIIILWLYFFFQLSEILTDFSAFSSGTSKIIGLGITVIMAQTGIIRKIVEFFGWIVFSQEAAWIRLIILIVIVFLLAFLYKFVSAIGKKAKQNREEMEKEKGTLASKKIEAFADAIEKGMKD